MTPCIPIIAHAVATMSFRCLQMQSACKIHSKLGPNLRSKSRDSTPHPPSSSFLHALLPSPPFLGTNFYHLKILLLLSSSLKSSAHVVSATYFNSNDIVSNATIFIGGPHFVVPADVLFLFLRGASIQNLPVSTLNHYRCATASEENL